MVITISVTICWKPGLSRSFFFLFKCKCTFRILLPLQQLNLIFCRQRVIIWEIPVRINLYDTVLTFVVLCIVCSKPEMRSRMGAHWRTTFLVDQNRFYRIPSSNAIERPLHLIRLVSRDMVNGVGEIWRCWQIRTDRLLVFIGYRVSDVLAESRRIPIRRNRPRVLGSLW